MNWDDLFPMVRKFAASAPKSVLRQSLRESARSFCDESRAWRTTGYEWLHAGVDRYEIRPPGGADAALVAVPALGVDGSALSENGDYWIEAGEVVLRRTPEKSGQLEYTAAWMPTVKARGLPDAIGERWGDVIGHGAAARLAEIPGKTWSSPETAQYHWRRYRSGVSQALSAEMKGGTDRSLTVKPRRFV